MNPHLQTILNFIQQSSLVNGEEKSILLKSITDLNKELEITHFKLDRTEKVKKTTAILLEETIEELEQKRKAVEAQNRELEIESTLERIRSRTLVMKDSKELNEAVAVFFQQFQSLNLLPPEARTYFCHINPETEVAEVWMTHADGTVMQGSHKTPLMQSQSLSGYLDAWKRKEPIMIRNYSGESLNEYMQFLSTLPHVKNDKDYQKLFDSPPERIIMTDANFLQGSIGIMTFEPLTQEALDTLIRFAKVFEFTYTRFLDLQKAEAQSREARIETALERVRSRTMGMQHSHELPQAAYLLFQQVQSLAVPAWSAGYGIWQDDKQAVTLSMSTEGQLQLPFKAPLTEDPSFIHMREAYERGESFHEEAIGGEELEKHYRYMRTLPVVGEILDAIIDAGHPLPTFQIFHVAYFSKGFLLFITYEPVPEAHDIFKRFAAVFDQTYTRFLDLQKAEAQAREANIEAALERVRSRTMGMQKSDELKGIIQVVYEQFVRLNILIEHTGFIIDYKASDDMHIWLADRQEIPTQVTIPYFDCAHWNSFKKAKEKGMDFFANHLGFEEKNRFYQDLFRLVPGVPEEAKEYYFNSPGVAISTVLLDTVGLYIENFSGIPYTDEENATLMRFGRVFQQTYTRFLDLQKAEAQAREAQIEAALERIRNRTLLMRESSELAESASILFQEFRALDLLPPDARTYFNVIDEANQTAEVWMTHADGGVRPGSFLMPLTTSQALRNMSEAWKRNEAIHIRDLTGERLREYIDVLKGIPSLRADKSYQQLFKSPPQRRVISEAIYLQGTIGIISDMPVSNDALETLVRFAKVFEFTYTRFLDLQKAEAQAKEAQIEVALEKIRSRSLAMHHSVEIKDVVSILFEKLKELNLVFDGGAAIHLFTKGSRNAVIWVASPDLTEPSCVNLPYDENAVTNNPIIQDVWKAKETGEHIFNKIYPFEQKNIYFDYVFKHNDFLTIPNHSREFILQADSYTASFIAEQNSLLGANSWTRQVFSDNDFEVLKRVARVFEQAYVRFLDLQKAEAQAREAQIELGLERVRARAMAMQNSEELNALIGTVFIELTRLDLALTRCVIMIYEPATNAARWWMANSEAPETPMNFLVKYHKHPPNLAYLKAWQERTLKWQYILEGTIKKEWDDFIFSETELSLLPDFVIAGMRAPDRVYLNASFNNFGNLTLASLESLSDEHFDILLRFAKVFDLTYTRFNDLQKAEAQAREAQIEAALERVRARTMGMHKSDELLDVINVVSEQLRQLDFKFDNVSFGVNSPDYDFSFWMAAIGRSYPILIHAPYLDHPVINRVKEAQKEGQGFFADKLTQEENAQWIHHLFNNADVNFPEKVKQFLLKSPGYSRSTVIMQNIFLFIGNYRAIPYTDEENGIFKRFAGVFEQSYTRFLDLQKAEAQAREAQIEVSLERVRSKAMAMQKSEDLANAVAIVFEELDKLNLGMLRCGIGILNKEKRSADVWTTTISDNDTVVQVSGDESMDIHPLLQGAFDAWLNQADHSYVLKGEDLNDYYKALTGVNFKLPDSQSLVTGAEGVQQYYFNAVFSAGGLFAFRETEFPEEAKVILKRFADVFHLTYTRFNDLKQAEAQARESKIEAGLERVRARTMAMHNSEDVSTATATMFNELEKLNIQNFRGGILNIKPDETMEVWSINPLDDGSLVRAVGMFDMRMHPFWQQLFKGWKNKDEIFHFDMSGKDKEDYIRLLDARRDYLPKGIQQLPDSYVQAYFFGEGYVWTFSLQPHSEEEKQVMKRFASVFSLTFRRYQDLKQAEAQAKEAKIEAALERVRGKAMAMHNSQDLSATIGVFYRELETFSITPRRCGVGLLNKETRMAELSTMNTTEVGDSIEIIGTLKMQDHPVLEGVYDNWLLQKEYHPVLRGNEIKEYYQLLRPQIAFPDYPNDEVQFGYFFFFNEGGVYAWTGKEMNEDELQIYRRFTTVLSLTYKRYIDLKQAEFSAKEAVKQSALDHIRADIASMRTTNDLEKITPLIWNELTILGVPFIRCGVFIMDESQQLIHTFLSTPDGKAFAAFHLPYATPGNISDVLDHWHHKKVYTAHWDESAFTEFAGTLVKQGALSSPEQYLKTIPPGGFYLHFFPFLQGMLYVGNTTRFNDDEINLIQSLADTFSTAYARYEDFRKLESAKEQVEKTLVDLKQAQALLVQSEKMASLGELTAGIAHEIQNPLNFVNNFSEVNQELLQEMQDEIDKGNFREVKAAATAIIENEAKINHHGKRAEGIVKSMLQHSRSSSGVKEPTGINALVDEYLHLAYHGLRAKDKSFNATLKHDYDQSIGSINVIPQDLGRVVLNLITNAFHAVTEKRKQSGKGYEPTVLVSTKKTNGKIEINVEDNGNGIPAKVLDKIFQPFFTTKPTGAGTGLGLSLAYDIVKAHGGDLNVQTREGEGSSFIILLPTV